MTDANSRAQILLKLEESYILETPVVARVIEGHFGSFAFVVQSGKDRYFVKRQPEWKTPSRLSYEAKLTRALRQVNPELTPDTIPQRNGREAFRLAGRLWTVAPYIADARQLDWTEKQWSDDDSKAAGLLLSNFHTSGRKSIENGFLRLSPGQVRSKLKALGQSVQDLLPLVPHSGGDSFAANLNSLFERQSASGMGIIHGDFHPENLLYFADREPMVVDLDYSGPGLLLFDVAYGYLLFSAPWHDSRDWNSKRLGQAFLAGYHKDLTADDSNLGTMTTFVTLLVIRWLESQKGNKRAEQLALRLRTCLSTEKSRIL